MIGLNVDVVLMAGLGFDFVLMAGLRPACNTPLLCLLPICCKDYQAADAVMHNMAVQPAVQIQRLYLKCRCIVWMHTVFAHSHVSIRRAVDFL